MTNRNRYSVEEIRKMLYEKGEFAYTYLNEEGKELHALANMIVFSKFISKAHNTNEICVAYEDYEITCIIPISQIIEIKD